MTTEGLIGPDGKWWTPQKVHAWCSKRMEKFDALSRDARDKINENGALAPSDANRTGEAYGDFLNSYRPPETQ